LIILLGIYTFFVDEDLLNFYEPNHNLLGINDSVIKGL